MARSRITRPEFLERPERATVSRDAQLLYLLMKLLADDYGRLLDSPKAIAGGAFPLDEEFTTELSVSCIDELVNAGWIRRYSGDERCCLYVERWDQEQKVAHKTPSTLPDPESPGHDHSGTSHESVMNDSGDTPTSVSAFASVPDPVFASDSVEKEIVDSRVTTTGDPISSSPPPEDQESEQPLSDVHRRQLIAATGKLGEKFNARASTEATSYPQSSRTWTDHYGNTVRQ